MACLGSQVQLLSGPPFSAPRKMPRHSSKSGFYSLGTAVQVFTTRDAEIVARHSGFVDDRECVFQSVSMFMYSATMAWNLFTDVFLMNSDVLNPNRQIEPRKVIQKKIAKLFRCETSQGGALPNFWQACSVKIKSPSN